MKDRCARILIKAVGDIAPGDCSIEGFGVLSFTKRYGCEFPFRNLDDMFDGADILIGNLEGVLSHRCLKENLRLGGLPQMAKTLRGVGFDAVSLANNHVFDHGPDVLNETVSICREAGLEICGLKGESDYYCEPVIFERESIKIGILAYNWVGLEGRDGIGDHIAVVRDSVVNYTWHRDRDRDLRLRRAVAENNKLVLTDIKRLKNEVDLVVLMPHWGYEWTIYPPYGVILEARTFVDVGASLIIGSHPHVPQGIELYKNSLIAYSLGNFLFDYCCPAIPYGMVLECGLSRSGIDGYKYAFVRPGKFYQVEMADQQQHQEMANVISESTKAIMSDDAEERLDDELLYGEYEKQYNRLKLRKITYLLLSLFKHPSLIKPICLKVVNLIELILLRLRGKKVRW